MKSIAVFVLFLGMFLVVQGYYQQKLTVLQQKEAKSGPVKFIPRTTYEDQLAENPTISQQFKSMFDDIGTWPTVRG